MKRSCRSKIDNRLVLPSRIICPQQPFSAMTVNSFRSREETKKVLEGAVKDYAKMFKQLGQKVRPGL